jgi:hypothetical protein
MRYAFWALLLGMCTITYAFGQEGVEPMIATNGASTYVISLAADATVPEQTAARELQEHLQAMTGATLPIVREHEFVGRSTVIYVGQTKALAAAFPDLDLKTLGQDGVVLKRTGPRLFLAGGRPRGTLYAVYTFLEDVLGCRWWTVEANFIPSRPTLPLPALDEVYVPTFSYREQLAWGTSDGVFAARMKLNGTIYHQPEHQRIPEAYGGHYLLLGFVHTFWMLLPHEKYVPVHPEWYSMIGGQRVGKPEKGHPNNVQLCLTNTEMQAEMARNARQWLRDNPRATMISITANDGHGFCECPKCRSAVQREGSQAGPLLECVNAVAAEVEKEFPGVLVETLAYSVYQDPPRHVRPRDNVLVRFCTYNSTSWGEPLSDSHSNAVVRGQIEGWSEISRQLFIWDYATNFQNYILPHPNWRVIAPNLRYFAGKTTGMFLQGDSHCSAGDFVELRSWVQAHLMWKPDSDMNALIEEFLAGYYGPAAPLLRLYLDRINDAQARSGASLGIGYADCSAFLSLDDLNACTELFAAAEQAVGADAELRTRVRRARMPLDHDWLLRYWNLRRTARVTGKPFLGPQDPQAACEDFFARLREFKVGRWRESGGDIAAYEPVLRAKCMPPPAATPPAKVAGLADSQWLDIQDREMALCGSSRLERLDDPQASDGRAIRMETNHTDWAVQYTVGRELQQLGGGRARWFVSIRAETKAAEGTAVNIGIYDTVQRKTLGGLNVPIRQAADGKYHVYDLGVHKLTSAAYIYLAPANNPKAVDAIYVDRMFAVAE